MRIRIQEYVLQLVLIMIRLNWLKMMRIEHVFQSAILICFWNQLRITVHLIAQIIHMRITRLECVWLSVPVHHSCLDRMVLIHASKIVFNLMSSNWYRIESVWLLVLGDISGRIFLGVVLLIVQILHMPIKTCLIAFTIALPYMPMIKPAHAKVYVLRLISETQLHLNACSFVQLILPATSKS